MTEKTQPSDAERDQFEEMMRLETFDDLSRLGDGSYTSYEARVGWIAWQAARRTPAPVGVGDVTKLVQAAQAFVLEPTSLQKKLHLEAQAWGPLAGTPQPTQAQAGAVPLTCEWAHNENDGFWESACGEAWRFDDGGPAENSMHFCHSCGKSLRIKGKEAGNADA